MKKLFSLLLITVMMTFATLAFAAVEPDDDYYDAKGVW